MSETRFFGLPLLTRPGRVMTPRAATEQLVAEALERIGTRPARVVDVGTGSGAVAIALASASPDAEVWAIDTSLCAVALAHANVTRHGLGDRVCVRHGNLLDPVPGAIDVVVANLPYLPEADTHRHPDLDGEPWDAVFAAGDGLGPYRRLVAASAERLRGDGALVIQLHRRVLAASRSELEALERELARHSRRAAPALVARLAPATA